jgi:SAM-dependent methyltransferase
MPPSRGSDLKAYARQFPLLVAIKRLFFPPPTPAPRIPGPEKIARYQRVLPPGADLKVVFGGHWSDHPGWLILTEHDQDITRRLEFADGTVDAVFSEHVIEHVPFVGAVHFLQESFRVLKNGGICRVVCPMLDRLLTADLSDANGRTYAQNSLAPYFASEQSLLADTLGLKGIDDDPLPFMFNFLYMGHDHRFIWTSGLMIKVMKAIGFHDVMQREPGQGLRADYCIERRRRGIYLGYDWQEDRRSGDVYDVESFAVEAVK